MTEDTDHSDVVFEVSVYCETPWIVVKVRGELDLATASKLEDSLHPFRHREELILFDLGGVEFIDIVGIKPIVVRCHDDLARIGITSRSVRRMLRLLGSDFRVDRWLVRSTASAVGF